MLSLVGKRPDGPRWRAHAVDNGIPRPSAPVRPVKPSTSPACWINVLDVGSLAVTPTNRYDANPPSYGTNV